MQMLGCHGQGHELLQGTSWYPETGCKAWVLEGAVHHLQHGRSGHLQGLFTSSWGALHLKHLNLGSLQKMQPYLVPPSSESVLPALFLAPVCCFPTAHNK